MGGSVKQQILKSLAIDIQGAHIADNYHEKLKESVSKVLFILE